MFRRVCAWCSTELEPSNTKCLYGETGPVQPTVTHGMCQSCYNKQMAEIDRLQAEADQVKRNITTHNVERN